MPRSTRPKPQRKQASHTHDSRVPAENCRCRRNAPRPSSLAYLPSEYLADVPIYFYKPDSPNGVFSQWYPSTFTDTFTTNSGTSTVTFANCEQYMMYRKALLFAPSSEITAQILTTTNPRTLKSLGRKVPDFVEEVWVGQRFGIVRRANLLKFHQNEDLKKQLLRTGERLLVEAAPRDRIWGCGFGTENAEKWRNVEGKWGLNLLGNALMEAREELVLVDKGKVELVAKLDLRLDKVVEEAESE
ncbi:DUF1768-domain-containing protein [Ascobolus immersus RN42]|uniref:DUF1768-domain-containing protein n=1 Tax=Ascobolus immersus RN42 TaxID=1160509 RepID=A0A3N4IRL5_ASCIM|nr:DUF1768-domain-containing protein [Ascobolus immersus RN42]